MKISYNDTQLFLSLSLSTQISIPSDFQSKFSPSLSRSHFTFAQNNCRADNSHERIKRNHFQCLKKNIPYVKLSIDHYPNFSFISGRLHVATRVIRFPPRRYFFADFPFRISRFRLSKETRHLERSETVSGVAIWREFD